MRRPGRERFQHHPRRCVVERRMDEQVGRPVERLQLGIGAAPLDAIRHAESLGQSREPLPPPVAHDLQLGAVEQRQGTQAGLEALELEVVGDEEERGAIRRRLAGMESLQVDAGPDQARLDAGVDAYALRRAPAAAVPDAVIDGRTAVDVRNAAVGKVARGGSSTSPSN